MGLREKLHSIHTFLQDFKIPEIKYQEQILFCIVFSIIFYSLSTTTDDMESNSKKAIICIVILFICEGMVKPYDIIYLRPCMGFWRIVLCIVQIYEFILLFLLFQTPSDGRKVMHFIDSRLGEPVPTSMHTYDDNCELEWVNLLDNLDHYYLIHWINFICIAIIFRDYYYCWLWSAFTEILEISLQHILPHFRECWWDHIIVDMIMSNTPAIIFGMSLLKLLKIELYDPLGRIGTKSIKEWQIWQCHRRFGLFIAQNVTFIVAFAGGFFLINGLWIPPTNPIPSIRLIVWFAVGALTAKEVYFDLKTWNQQIRRERPISGKMRWNAVCVIITEVVCTFKYTQGAGNMEDTPTPLYIIIPWVIVTITCLVFYLYLRFKPGHTTMYGPQEQVKQEEKEKKKSL